MYPSLQSPSKTPGQQHASRSCNGILRENSSNESPGQHCGFWQKVNNKKIEYPDSNWSSGTASEASMTQVTQPVSFGSLPRVRSAQTHDGTLAPLSHRHQKATNGMHKRESRVICTMSLETRWYEVLRTTGIGILGWQWNMWNSGDIAPLLHV